MNILFVLYDGYHSNSATYVVGYARALAREGHGVAVAIPDSGPECFEGCERYNFNRVTHGQIARGFTFPNGGPPDIVHAWTPRENVRKAAFGCVANTGAKLVVHLEDHEDHITSTILAQTAEELSELSELELARILPQKLSHPRLADLFIRMADAVTVVWPSLNDFVPQQIPKHHLRMCPDPARLSGCISPAEMAAKLGVHTNENLIVYSGHLNSVNRADQSALYEAIVLLNSQGVSCRLIRTGPNTQGIAESLAVGSAPYVVEAGLLSEEELAATMRLATVFVQPGRNDVFNRYRMPCKVGEFLHIGCPVVLPETNVAEWMTDGETALFLHEGAPQEIASKCREILSNSVLREKLGRAAKVFANTHFDLAKNAADLLLFYRSVCGNGSKTKMSTLGEIAEINFLAAALEKTLERDDVESVRLVSKQLTFGIPFTAESILDRQLESLSSGITVIIVFYHGLDDLKRCLVALEDQTLQAEKIIIVDNSPAGQCREIADNARLLLLRPEKNLGFAAGNNWAIRKAKTDLVLTLNADAFPKSNCLAELAKAASRHSECAAFGCVTLQAEDERLLDGIGDVYHCSGLMWRRGYARLASKFEIVDGPICSPCGAAALYRKSVFDALGGFDEDFFCYCEDVDLGLRIWSDGWTCRLVAGAVVSHKGSGSTGKQSDFAVYHGHRNLVWVFIKNMPGFLFYFFLPLHLLANIQLRRAVSRQGQGEIMRKSNQDALRGVPRFWRKRRELASKRRIRCFAFRRFMDFSMPPEPLRAPLWRQLLKLKVLINKKITRVRASR